MSLRNGSWKDQLDFFIGWHMKNWLAQHSPPPDGYARLMRAVSLKTPTVQSGWVTIAQLIAWMFSRTWKTLLFHAKNQNGILYLPAELGYVRCRYSDISLQLERHPFLLLHPIGTALFCLIS